MQKQTRPKSRLSKLFVRILLGWSQLQIRTVWKIPHISLFFFIKLLYNVAFIFSPKFDIPQPDPAIIAKKNAMVCHTCQEPGHKAAHCPKLSRSETS